MIMWLVSVIAISIAVLEISILLILIVTGKFHWNAKTAKDAVRVFGTGLGVVFVIAVGVFGWNIVIAAWPFWLITISILTALYFSKTITF